MRDKPCPPTTAPRRQHHLSIGFLVGLAFLGAAEQAIATAFTGVRLDFHSTILLDNNSSTTVAISRLGIAPPGPSAFIEADATRGTIQGWARADHSAGHQAGAGASTFEAGRFVVSDFTAPVTFRFRYDIEATTGAGGSYNWGLTAVLGPILSGIDVSALFDSAVGSVVEDGDHADARILELDADGILAEATLSSAITAFDFSFAIGVTANADIAATFSLFLPAVVRMISDSGEFLSEVDTVAIDEPSAVLVLATALLGLLLLSRRRGYRTSLA